MFPRPSSSAYVCLRCHLRLARGNLHPLSTALSQPSRHSVSNPRSLHNSPRSQFTITRELVGSDRPDTRRSQRPGEHGRPHGDRCESPAGFRRDRAGGQSKAKLRGQKGGQQVREDAEALSVNALGKPTEVIVLRDTPPDAEQEAAKQKEKEEDEHAAEGPYRKTLLATIEEEDVPMDQDTVNQQLDELWSRTEIPNSERSMIAQNEYLQLCKLITKRYSNKQIDGYIARSRRKTPKRSSAQPHEFAENLIANKSPNLHFRPWLPKTTNKSIGLKATRYPQFKRANIILKKCWKLEITEEVERLGELVCTLPKSGVRLLGAGKPSFLDEITENRQAKLEIDGSNIRIIADKSSAIYALEDINRLWSQHVVKTFPLNLRVGQLTTFRPEDVALVSSLTRTTMNYANNSNRKTVAITGIGNDSVEDAFSAILALIDIPLESTTFKKRTLHKMAGTADTVMQEISDLEALPYRDRSSSYGRFWAPITRKQREQPQSEPESPHISDKVSSHDSSSTLESEAIAQLIDMTRNWLLPTVPTVIAPITGESTAWAKFWNTQSSIACSASLGSILHPINSVPALGNTPAALPLNVRFLRRVPGFSRLLPHLLWDRKEVTNILSFRLLHNPWRSSGSRLPDMRLDFEIKSEIKPFGEARKNVDFKGLNIISRDRRNFVMTPSKAVDLCLKSQETYHANHALLDAQPEVKTFIEQTKANIVADSGTLRTPPSVRIHLPCSFDGHGRTTASRNSRKKPDAGDAPETVKDTGILANYYFAGVEHIQLAGYTFEGHPVRYTNVEGGKLGGKYGNLEIFMPQTEESRGEEEGVDQPEAFIRSVLNLVNLVDTAAQGRLKRPGRRVTEDGGEDHEEGMEQWMPEHLGQKSSQPLAAAKREQEVNGTEEGADDELPESADEHAPIATGPEEIDLIRVAESDPSAEAPPVAPLDNSVQPPKVASDECPSDQDQATITKPLHAEDSESPEPEQRAAASG